MKTLLISAILLLYPLPSFSSENCKQVFKDNSNKQLSPLTNYMLEAVKKSPKNITPTHDDLQEDIQRSAFWNGNSPPKVLQESLPKDITFLDHSQIGSEGIGLVKKNRNGVFTSVRYTGGDNPLLGTSVGVNAHALKENMIDNTPYLVRKESRAAILWLHGGGTKTTGYQTASNIVNMFSKVGIDVISISLPLHEEGPRYIFKNEVEYFDYLHQILIQYVPKDVPIFVMGHSMGGLLSDMINRKTDDPNSKLGQLIAGTIPLAPVADFHPGGTYREKLKKERVSLTDEAALRKRGKTSPSDDTIFQSLIRENKLSHLSFIFNTPLMLMNDWTIPKHKGRDYKPSLYILGSQDGLTYVGYEKDFSEYVEALENVDYHLMQPAYNPKGEITQYAGHVDIIDKKDLEKDKPEFLVKTLKFIEKTLDIKLDRMQNETNKLETSIHGTHGRFIKEWANNLIFRRFVKHHTYTKKTPTQKMNLLSEIANQLTDLKKTRGMSEEDFYNSLESLYPLSEKSAKEIVNMDVSQLEQLTGSQISGPKQKEKEIKKIALKNISEENQNKLSKLETLSAELSITLNKIRGDAFIPLNTENSNWIEENINSRQDKASQIKTLTTEIKELKKESNEYEIAFNKENKNFTNLSFDIKNNIINALNVLETDGFLKELFASSEQIEKEEAQKIVDFYKKEAKPIYDYVLKEDEKLKKLFLEDLDVRKKIEDFIVDLMEKKELDNSLADKLPESLNKQIKDYANSSNEYQKTRNQFTSFVYERVRTLKKENSNLEDSKKTDLDKITESLIKLYGKKSDLETQNFDENSLAAKWLEVSIKMEEKSRAVEELSKEKDALLKKYVEKVVPSFMEFKVIYTYQEMHKKESFDQLNKENLEKIITNWDALWKRKAPQFILKNLHPEIRANLGEEETESLY